MGEDTKKKTSEASADKAPSDEPAAEQQQESQQNGPTFTKGPDPLAGVKKGAADVLASMEGKTVSMKVYLGTVLAVIVLMLLARCG